MNIFSSVHKDKNFTALSKDARTAILTEFVRSVVPTWPSDLTLEKFIRHMTVDHDRLVRNHVVYNNANDSLSRYDILLNPARKAELADAIKRLNDMMTNAFVKMDVTDALTNRLILAILWFSGTPCQELLVSRLLF